MKKIISKSLVYKKEVSYENYIDSLDEKVLDYVFFGDSHAAGAVNPKYIENSFNYANFGNSYIEIYHKLKKVVENEGIKVENVVLEIDPHIFSSRLDDGEYLFRDLWYYSQFVSPNELKAIRDRSSLYYYIKSKFPVVGDSIKFGMLLDDHKSTDIYLGWNKNAGDFSRSEDGEKGAKKVYQYFFEDKELVSPVIFDYYKKTLEFSRENDINIILIKYPHSREYIEILNRNIDIDRHYVDIFAKTAAIIDNYRVLDYYELYDDTANYFHNADHLNYTGAENLSKMLNNSIKNNEF